ncbi:hypothetical protein [Actinoplanes sp. G11-F43]
MHSTSESTLADRAEEYSVGRSTIHRVIHGNPATSSHEQAEPQDHPNAL